MRFLSSFYFAVCVLFILPVTTQGQKLRKADHAVINNLRAHVSYLSDDKLEGRRAGTKGEKLAMEYISGQFQKNKLIPRGDHGSFFQAFPMSDGKSYEQSFLFINDHEIKGADFFPLANSPEANITSAPSIAIKEPGAPWFLNLAEEPALAVENPHFDVVNHAMEKAKLAAKKGAKALFVYTTNEKQQLPAFNRFERSEVLPIPVIFVSHAAAKKFFTDEAATLDIRLKTALKENTRTAHNVIGYIDNHAAGTIVLGAHFDHLGYGEDGNSLMTGPEKQVHNGADDNASGVAALIELSKLIKNSKLKNYNYLFIAFSGEEAGLLGSKYYTEHPTVSLSQVNYMINMDMIGRLNDSSKSITVGGYGTSPLWPELFASVKPVYAFSARYDSSGAGPSDHTSFYRKEIPVLFFFTGIHHDYHKPGDDATKLNYVGQYRVVEYIYQIIEATQKKGKLAFQKTRDQQPGQVASFTVGLGIMPDYSFSGTGVRIDGISEGRAAQKAGLQAGDIVIQLGEKIVTSLENYMQALSSYKKGDKTTVKVKRATKTIEADITF